MRLLEVAVGTLANIASTAGACSFLNDKPLVDAIMVLKVTDSWFTDTVQHLYCTVNDSVVLMEVARYLGAVTSPSLNPEAAEVWFRALRAPVCVARTVDITANTLYQPLLSRMAALVLSLMYHDATLYQLLVQNGIIDTVTNALKDQLEQPEIKCEPCEIEYATHQLLVRKLVSICYVCLNALQTVIQLYLPPRSTSLSHMCVYRRFFLLHWWNLHQPR